MNFETIQRNYDRKLWSAAQVRVAVKKGVITSKQYEEITGEMFI